MLILQGQTNESHICCVYSMIPHVQVLDTRDVYIFDHHVTALKCLFFPKLILQHDNSPKTYPERSSVTRTTSSPVKDYTAPTEFSSQHHGVSHHFTFSAQIFCTALYMQHLIFMPMFPLSSLLAVWCLIPDWLHLDHHS